MTAYCGATESRLSRSTAYFEPLYKIKFFNSYTMGMLHAASEISLVAIKKACCDSRSSCRC